MGGVSVKKLLSLVILGVLVLGVASTALAENGSIKPWSSVQGENGTIDPLEHGPIKPWGENGSIKPWENGGILPW